MPVINFKENRSLKEQLVPFLNEGVCPMMNQDEQTNTDAANNTTSRRDDDAKSTEIGISDQDFRVINQLTNQKCQKLFSALEEIIIQQSVS